MNQIFGNAEAVPTLNFYRRVETEIRKMAKEMKAKNKAIADVSTRMTRLETERDNVRAQIAAKEADVKKMEEKIEKVCQGVSLDESIVTAKDELKVSCIFDHDLIHSGQS